MLPALETRSLAQAAPARRRTAACQGRTRIMCRQQRSSQSEHAEESYLEKSRVVAHRTRNEESDIFRRLRTQVLQAMAQAEHRSLAITSPNYGDGKTTVAFNLAVSIALDVKQTVLLVDLDLRKPDMHKIRRPRCAARPYRPSDQ